jgi:hypothetical protein
MDFPTHLSELRRAPTQGPRQYSISLPISPNFQVPDKGQRGHCSDPFALKECPHFRCSGAQCWDFPCAMPKDCGEPLQLGLQNRKWCVRVDLSFLQTDASSVFFFWSHWWTELWKIRQKFPTRTTEALKCDLRVRGEMMPRVVGVSIAKESVALDRGGSEQNWTKSLELNGRLSRHKSDYPDINQIIPA